MGDPVRRPCFQTISGDTRGWSTAAPKVRVSWEDYEVAAEREGMQSDDGETD